MGSSGTGPSIATVLPRSVTSKLSPACTRRSHWLAFCRSSRTLIFSIVLQCSMWRPIRTLTGSSTWFSRNSAPCSARSLPAFICGGPLATGDFDAETSDIDFVAPSTGAGSPETFLALDAMHTRIAATGLYWANRIEVDYLPQATLRRYDPLAAPHPRIGVGERLHLQPPDSSGIIKRHILRERGLVLAGPDPKSLIDPISPDDLRRACRGDLAEWWAPRLADVGPLASREYQAYAVLTMCRMLCTLQHGAIVSKPAAARWALENVGSTWASLIERAMVWRQDPGPDDLKEALAFIRFTLKQAGVQ